MKSTGQLVFSYFDDTEDGNAVFGCTVSNNLIANSQQQSSQYQLFQQSSEHHVTCVSYHVIIMCFQSSWIII